MAAKKSSGKRMGRASVKANAKRRVADVEKKFGSAVRKSTEMGGRKPPEWEQPKKRDVRGLPTAPEFDVFSENPNGYEATATRAVEATASELFRAFNDPTRRLWSHVTDYVVRSTVAPRLLRLGMRDGSLVTVTITRKGNVRSAVDIQHSMIASAEAAELSKRQWREALARLAGMLAE